MYESTLPSPCCTKPHFCVQPRKPRQRGGRRAKDLDKTRYLGLSCCPKYRVFCILHGDVFCGLLRLRRIFCLGGIPRSYECVKIRVRLMRTEEDVNENRAHFVHVSARLASLPRGEGGATAYVACFIFTMRLNFRAMSFALLSCWWGLFMSLLCGKNCWAYVSARVGVGRLFISIFLPCFVAKFFARCCCSHSVGGAFCFVL